MRGVVAVLLASQLIATVGAQDPPALRARGFEAAYNLDHEEALAAFQKALIAAPDDPATHRAIATINWLNIAFTRGTVTTDEYLGGAPRQTLELPPPPREQAELFHRHASRALALAEQRVQSRPRDPNGHYELGATVGLMASYTASVEGRMFRAFRSAKRAYDAHERVLELDPRRKDAALVVGTYRYIVSTLSMPGRWLAYVVGFGGGRERGIAMVAEAANYRSDAQTDAQFALVLLYNREKQYDAALKVLTHLRQRYPRNRLLWLESGATALRARRLEQADAHLTEGLRLVSRDARRRMFGEEALWRYKLGEVQLARGNRSAARTNLRAALDGSARDWVRARTHLALGKIADASGERTRAREHYTRAVRLAEVGRDPATRREAQRFIRQPFR